MSSVGRCRAGLACALVLACAGVIHAEVKPLTKEEQDKVDKAIARGVRFLRHMQRPSGLFPRDFTGKLPDNFPYLMGHTLLPALAMLECGVPPSDPALKKVTALLRKSARRLDSTYELSLAILYFDRLGERQDEEIIRTLALRLMAGQSYTGGWTYRCPRLSAEQEAELLKALRAMQGDATQRAPRPGEKHGEEETPREVPAALAKLAVFQKPETLFARKEVLGKENSILFVGSTDNSNTQFAMLGLWTASRHDLPLVPTFRLLARRFECSQGDDGTWDYLYQFGGRRARRPEYIADTGVGLLALAIARTAVPAEKAEQEHWDRQIVRGFAALSRDVGAPMDPTLPNYYFLWTVERVAALYNLRAIGDKDWYRWGAAALIAAQEPRGSWPHNPSINKPFETGSYGFTLNTSFALLFLRQSNWAKDLSAKLPLKPEELNKGILVLTGAPAPKDTSPGSTITRDQTARPPR